MVCEAPLCLASVTCHTADRCLVIPSHAPWRVIHCKPRRPGSRLIHQGRHVGLIDNQGAFFPSFFQVLVFNMLPARLRMGSTRTNLSERGRRTVEKTRWETSRCAPRSRYGLRMLACNNAVWLPYCAGHNLVTCFLSLDFCAFFPFRSSGSSGIVNDDSILPRVLCMSVYDLRG
jgi:hypothetical protein